MNKRKFLAAFAAVVLSASVITALPAKSVSAEWEKTSSGYSYKDDETGKKLKGWQKIDGKKYYFDKKGNAVTGFKKIDGKTYYFIPNKKGQMATKWQKIGFDRYYFAKDGSMYSNCWMTLSGKKYYCTSDGKIAVGMKYINGKTYSFDQNGVLLDNAQAAPKFGTSYESEKKILEKRYDYVFTEETVQGRKCLGVGIFPSEDLFIYMFDDKAGLVMYGAVSYEKNAKK
ncbi:MAG: hypothetical protein II782_04815, partial [Oscillospiraceae bacterium]|nr:hypothetical protein [Oscillospiraceae bacterium]